MPARCEPGVRGRLLELYARMPRRLRIASTTPAMLAAAGRACCGPAGQPALTADLPDAYLG
jgi:hypothetical protein